MNIISDMSPGQKVRFLRMSGKGRLNQKLTLREFAKELGVSHTTIHNIENDAANSSKETWEKIAAYFDKPLSFFQQSSNQDKLNFALINEITKMLSEHPETIIDIKKQLDNYLSSGAIDFTIINFDSILNRMEMSDLINLNVKIAEKIKSKSTGEN